MCLVPDTPAPSPPPAKPEPPPPPPKLDKSPVPTAAKKTGSQSGRGIQTLRIDRAVGGVSSSGGAGLQISRG